MSLLTNLNAGGRLSDFFVVIGLPSEFILSPLTRVGTAAHEESTKDSSKTPSTILSSLDSTIVSCVFSASVTDYYGQDFAPLPEGIEIFAFPSGVQLAYRSSLPRFHSFVHTAETGARLYGSCLTFFEKITPSQVERAKVICKGVFIDSDYVGLYVPRCICIISSWAFIESFRAVLCEIYRLACTPCDLPMERYICNFIDDVPSPPAGRVDINFYICNKSIEFKCTPANQPTSWAGVPLEPLL